jgi:hypothetical protein
MMGIDDRYLKDTLGILDDKLRERWLRDHTNALSTKRQAAGTIAPTPSRVAPKTIGGVGGPSSNGNGYSNGTSNSTGTLPIRAGPGAQIRPMPAPIATRAAAPIPGIGRLPQRPGSAPPAPMIPIETNGHGNEEWNDEAMGVPAAVAAGGAPPPRPPPRNSFCRRYAAGNTTAPTPAPSNGRMGPPIGGNGNSVPRRGPFPIGGLRHSSSADDISSSVSSSSSGGGGHHARNGSTMSTSSSSSSSSLTAAEVEGWGIDEVCSWLKELNLDKYDAAFRREQVDGSVLMALTDKILEVSHPSFIIP